MKDYNEIMATSDEELVEYLWNDCADLHRDCDYATLCYDIAGDDTEKGYNLTARTWDALDNLSDATDKERECGIVSIDGVFETIYWENNNAGSAWFSDAPGHWEDQEWFIEWRG